MRVWPVLAGVILCLGAAPAFADGFDASIAAARGAMMSSPAEALRHAAAAEAAAGREADTATAEWLQGEALARLNQPAKALPVLERALAISRRVAPRAKLTGDILLSRGWVREMLGQIELAMKDFQTALNLFRAIGETRGQAKALGNIGGIYHDAGDNERSLRYYAEVNDVYRGDPAIAVAASNNVGETLKTLGRYPQAEAEYAKGLGQAAQLGSPLLQAHILTNLAATQLLRGKVAAADATARRALALAATGEAADERPFVYGVLAQIAWTRGDVAGARAMIARTFGGVDLSRSALPYRDFHKLAADIYRRSGQYDLAYAHLAAHKRLDDGVRQLAASTNAALMAASFDFQNQNLHIVQLRASRLQQDAALARSRARFRETVLTLVVVGGAIVTGLLLFGIVSLRRSRDKVRAANRQLSDVNVSLEKALKVKSEFLAMTSHEIRTPLNGILGMTQVMLADGRVDPAMRDRIEVVHGAGETMRALVDDILDLARIENGHLAVEREAVDLQALLRDAGRLWRARAEAKGLRLDLDLVGCPGRIEEDGSRLRQIVFNLMSNALKFTEQGSVTLAAEVVAGEGEGADERLVIRVSDTGIGIPPDQLDMIFEKFHQVDAGVTRRHGGTGLGLAISRHLAEAMGGALAVESEPDAGSVFTLVLPLRRLAALAEEPQRVLPGDPEISAPGQLLLVEPNPLTQRILARTLEDVAGAVRAVSDLRQARAALTEHSTALMLIQADALEGSEALADLIADGVVAGARVAVLFTPGPGLSEELILAVGADAAIAKPIAPVALAQRLRVLQVQADRADLVRQLAPAA